MPSGWRGAPCFGSHARELVSQPAISFKKRWGGYRRTTRGAGGRGLMKIIDPPNLPPKGRAGYGVFLWYIAERHYKKRKSCTRPYDSGGGGGWGVGGREGGKATNFVSSASPKRQHKKETAVVLVTTIVTVAVGEGGGGDYEFSDTLTFSQKDKKQGIIESSGISSPTKKNETLAFFILRCISPIDTQDRTGSSGVSPIHGPLAHRQNTKTGRVGLPTIS